MYSVTLNNFSALPANADNPYSPPPCKLCFRVTGDRNPMAGSLGDKHQIMVGMCEIGKSLCVRIWAHIQFNCANSRYFKFLDERAKAKG